MLSASTPSLESHEDWEPGCLMRHKRYETRTFKPTEVGSASSHSAPKIEFELSRRSRRRVTARQVWLSPAESRPRRGLFETVWRRLCSPPAGSRLKGKAAAFGGKSS